MFDFITEPLKKVAAFLMNLFPPLRLVKTIFGAFSMLKGLGEWLKPIVSLLPKLGPVLKELLEKIVKSPLGKGTAKVLQGGKKAITAGYEGGKKAVAVGLEGGQQAIISGFKGSKKVIQKGAKKAKKFVKPIGTTLSLPVLPMVQIN